MTRAILAAALLAAATAGSAAADCPKPEEGAAPVKVHVARDAGGTRVVIDTPILVCGRPPAPQVAYLAPAPHLDYAWSDVQLDFLPLIIRSVRRAPFEAQP